MSRKAADWRVALGGRRFLITVGAGIVNAALLMLGYVDMFVYRDLTIATVAAYIAADTYHKVRTHALTADASPDSEVRPVADSPNVSGS